MITEMVCVPYSRCLLPFASGHPPAPRHAILQGFLPTFTPQSPVLTLSSGKQSEPKDKQIGDWTNI